MPRNPGGATGYNRQRRLTASPQVEAPAVAAPAAEAFTEAPAVELPVPEPPKKPAKRQQPPR